MQYTKVKMKKIKTYLNYLEIITSVFIPYKDFDLEDFLDVPTVTDIMNAWALVCIEACVQNIIERTLLV